MEMGRVRNTVSEYQNLSAELSRISSELDQVRRNLRFKIGQKQQIERFLGQQSQAVAVEQQKMNSLTNALTDIADMYERTESALCEMGGAFGPESGKAGLDFLGPIFNLIVDPLIMHVVPWGYPKFFPKTWWKMEEDDLKYTFSTKPFDHKPDKPYDDSDGIAVEFSEKKEWKGSAYSQEITSGDKSDTHTYAKMTVAEAKAELEASAGLVRIDPKTGKTVPCISAGAAAGASFTLFTAEEQAQLGNDMAGVYVKSTQTVGKVGAKGEVKVGIHDKDGNFNPNVSAEARFEAIGGEISGTVGAKILGTDIGVKGSLNYGIGAHAEVGFEDGKLSFDVGASLGVGGSIKIELDVSGAVNAVKDTAKAVWDWIF